MPDAAQADELLALTTDIVASHVSNNTVAIADLPQLIQQVYFALAGVGVSAEAATSRPQPAVPIKKSVTADYIICLEEGKKLKMLKRYLRTNFDMSPAEYREKWGLPSDYPMVAPAYAEMRRDMAKRIGLGKAVNQKRGRRKKV